MFIRWHKRQRQPQSGKKTDVHWGAALTETTRIDGKPRQRHVAYLGSFTEHGIKSMHQRCLFWDRVNERLQAVSNRLTEEQRNRIVAEIASRVPVPTRAEHAQCHGENPATLEQLRTVLKPLRERYDFVVVMQRLAAEARENEDRFEWLAPPQGEDPTVPRAEWEAQENELIVELANCGPLKPSSAPEPRAGRPRADHERYVALLVGVVFHEYTLKSPKRVWNDYHDTDRTSPFYEFAAAVFRWLGFAPSWQAFREVSERWDSSREFSKRAIKVLLFGGLQRVTD